MADIGVDRLLAVTLDHFNTAVEVSRTAEYKRVKLLLQFLQNVPHATHEDIRSAIHSLWPDVQ